MDTDYTEMVAVMRQHAVRRLAQARTHQGRTAIPFDGGVVYDDWATPSEKHAEAAQVLRDAAAIEVATQPIPLILLLRGIT